MPGKPHPMLSRLVNRAGTMSSNVVPGLMTRPVFAKTRSARLPSPDREVCSAGYRGLIGSATTPKHDLQRGNYMDYNGPAVVQPIRPVAPYLRSTPEVYV